MSVPSDERVEFLISGIRHGPDSVTVVASNTLGEDGLLVTYERDRWSHQGTVTMSAQMANYMVAHGPDYETALRTLFGQWSPTPERQALADRSAVPELEQP